ncbi:precorrin-6A synthase (deacetylating) [Oryzifoliimicrobium ureilyticus]|uniref:precorrin-6A synthase (deacetylating) n=1 Tax=Oryzifoliimicrobium ureilyticus TaxID=3113724 RepID=UPI003076579F
MRQIHIIGIGTGNPEHLTIQAINVMNRADVIFIPLKGEGKEDLAVIRRDICARYLSHGKTRIVEFDLPVRDAETKSYKDGVEAWHEAIATIYCRLIDGLGEHEAGAFLVWGDPSLYDSTLRILERARGQSKEFSVRVVPGISSLHALTASHAIPLNPIGEPVQVTTGRRLADEGIKAGTTVVMLDGQQAFATVADDNADIFWGAYLGTDREIKISGSLSEVSEDILRARAEARERHGWIMDTYLIRKRLVGEE